MLIITDVDISISCLDNIGGGRCASARARFVEAVAEDEVCCGHDPPGDADGYLFGDRAPLVRRGVRRAKAAYLEGCRHEDPVDDDAQLSLPRCRKRSRHS